MTSAVEARLLDLGVTLPEPAVPVANYLPCVEAGNMLYTSGQLPLRNGALVSAGLLGREVDIATGQLAARWCAVNVLAQAGAVLGDLDRIKRLLKITVFVASAPGFTEQPLVANGASDLFVDALGDNGRHSRSAVGVAALPMNAPVEVEAVFEIR
ncbi:RidA family protein [Streptomyces sp. CA-249302]|uniref:RidA family protein n=1 Tax=Streptomyces sp. CA-249302 TaxID=3240058 RepID=UPI003D8C4500